MLKIAWDMTDSQGMAVIWETKTDTETGKCIRFEPIEFSMPQWLEETEKKKRFIDAIKRRKEAYKEEFPEAFVSEHINEEECYILMK